MTDDMISLRDSELRDRLAEAWDDGFSEGAAAERGDEYTPNPHSTPHCPVPDCGLYAAPGGRLCVKHREALAMLTRLQSEG